MSKEVLDTLYIAFKSSGAQEVRSQISNLEKHLEEFSKKIASVHSKALAPALKSLDLVAKRTSSALSQSHAKIISSARSVKKELGGITSIQRNFNKEVKKTSDIAKAFRDIAKGASRISVRIGGGGGGGRSKSPEEQAQAEEEKRLRAEQKANALAEKERIRNSKAMFNAVMRTTGMLITFAKVGSATYKRELNSMQKQQSFYNKIFFSGLQNERALSGAIRIAQYGGAPEELLAASQAVSTSLGAMTRGDTSLIEHLGKYGIGGISPKGTPEDVINAIKARIGRGDLSKNEINSLLAGLPFSEAMKMSIVKGSDLFGEETKAFEESLKAQEAMLEAARAQISVMESVNKINSLISDYHKKVSDWIQNNPEIVAWLEKIVPPLTGILTGIGMLRLAFGGMSGAFGTLSTTITVALKPLTWIADTLSGIASFFGVSPKTAALTGAMLLAPNTLNSGEDEMLRKMRWEEWGKKHPNATMQDVLNEYNKQLQVDPVPSAEPLSWQTLMRMSPYDIQRGVVNNNSNQNITNNYFGGWIKSPIDQADNASFGYNFWTNRGDFIGDALVGQ